MAALSRAIRLNENGLTTVLGNGLDYPLYPAFREVTSTIIKRKDELKVMPGSISRSLWRQLASITIKSRANPIRFGPLAPARRFRNQRCAALDRRASVRQGQNQGRNRICVHYCLECLVKWAEPLERGGHAEEIEGKLIQAIKTHSTHLKIGTPPIIKWTIFWTRVEQHLDF